MNKADRPDSLPEAPSFGELVPRFPCDMEDRRKIPGGRPSGEAGRVIEKVFDVIDPRATVHPRANTVAASENTF